MAELNEQMFRDDYKENVTINDYLSKGERILWHEKPKAKAYVFSQVSALTPVALIWLFFDGSIIGAILFTDAIMDAPFPMLLFLIGFFALHLTPVWIWLGSFFKSYSDIKNTEYYITNKRVIVTNFPKSHEIQEVNISDIQDVSLSKKGIDKLVRVGDIEIISKSGSLVNLHDIREPEKIYNIFEKIKSNYANLKGLPSYKICEYCGNTINEKSKKCESCGAQYTK